MRESLAIIRYVDFSLQQQKIAYMLEGYDEKMIVGIGENYVYYSNYTRQLYFLGKSINSDGIWNDQVASIHI